MRIEGGRLVAHVAHEMGVSRPTAHQWWRHWCEEGEIGLVDRSSRAPHCPHQTSPEVEAQSSELGTTLRLGPAQWLPSGRRTLDGAPEARALRSPPPHVDGPPASRVIRRYERESPGDLVPVDVKKLGRIPDGRGYKVLGHVAGHTNPRAQNRTRRAG